MTRSLPALVSMLAAVAAVALIVGEAGAQLRGHGGPVRALAISADGRLAISGGFDQSAIVWDVEAGAARSVIRFHDGAVHAVAFLPDNSFATAGEDGRIAIFGIGGSEPVQVFSEHRAPIVG